MHLSALHFAFYGETAYFTISYKPLATERKPYFCIIVWYLFKAAHVNTSLLRTESKDYWIILLSANTSIFITDLKFSHLSLVFGKLKRSFNGKTQALENPWTIVVILEIIILSFFNAFRKSFADFWAAPCKALMILRN